MRVDVLLKEHSGGCEVAEKLPVIIDNRKESSAALKGELGDLNPCVLHYGNTKAKFMES